MFPVRIFQRVYKTLVLVTLGDLWKATLSSSADLSPVPVPLPSPADLHHSNFPVINSAKPVGEADKRPAHPDLRTTTADVSDNAGQDGSGCGRHRRVRPAAAGTQTSVLTSFVDRD